MNQGKQMKNVWTISAPNGDEKKFEKHPTQKPLQLLERIIFACTKKVDIVFDPFPKSSTTVVPAIKLNRLFVGCELEKEYIELSVNFLKECLKKIKIKSFFSF